jgi:pantoate--beta-alanine ligase
MTVLRSLLELKTWRAQVSGEVGFVPTMGALHSGHVNLIQQSIKNCQHTLVSIFINPTQFNNQEDFEKYPASFQDDLLLLRSVGDVIVYSPKEKDIYPNGISSRAFNFGVLGAFMEGAGRPGHFEGMATVVTRFFELIEPHYAFFGEKDFQQLAIIKHVVASENWPVKIIPVVTVREKDGLAMSSRNRRLNAEQRNSAKEIYRILQQWISTSFTRHTDVSFAKKAIIDSINTVDFLTVEYLEFCCEKTLTPIDHFEHPGPIRVFTAVMCGKVRLIDNLPLF